MWNYSFVLPNFIALSTFLVFYFTRPRLPIKLNKSFLKIMFIEMAVLIIDVASSAALESGKSIPHVFLRIINVLFFALFILRAAMFFIFTLDIIKIRDGMKAAHQLALLGIAIVCEAIALANMFFDTFFSISETGEYAKCFLYNAIYVCSFFYIFASIAALFANRSRVPNGFFLNSCAFNIVLLIGTLTRIVFPKFLIMDSFCLLSIVIICLSFENSAIYVEPRSGLFNKKALRDILSELSGKRCRLILGFVLNNYGELREIYSGAQMDRGVALIGQFLAKSYPSLISFYLSNGRFAIIGKKEADAGRLMEEIGERFKKPWNAGAEVDISVDITFVQVKPEMRIDCPEKITNGLFAAMNSARTIGSGNVVVDEESIARIDSSTEIKRAVVHAVESNAVELFLQPLFGTRTGKIEGAEALARIRAADGSLISPTAFIPIAEKNGRITMLGEQMFEKTCDFIRNHDIAAMGISWINVNLSPIQFLRRDLNERFSAILEKYGVEAKLIHLEITEESMIDYALLQKQIQLMRNTGFQFVLDDYGSGYSNVTRLRKCPFVNVKLDMELVRDYYASRDDTIPTFVQMFKKMNFSVTAEGIENEEMARALTEIGCDYLQGFHFSAPIPAEEFAARYTPER